MKSFPLMLFALLFYNLVWLAGTGFGAHDIAPMLSKGVAVQMFSGDRWIFAVGDLILLVSLTLLFFEVIRSTRTGSIEILNHALSMLVFIVALVEFIVARGFSTSTFFFLTLMCLFDVVAGFTISIVAAKRDLGAGGGFIGTN